MISVYYVSGSTGEKLRLDQAPYWLQTGEILDYDWAFTEQNRKIKSFYKEIYQRIFLISIFGRSAEEYSDNWKKLHEVFERDVRNMKKGRLYFNDTYLRCYITGSMKTEWEADCRVCDNTFTVTTDYPFWIQEVSHHYGIIEEADSGLAYPYGYPYGYYAHVPTDNSFNTGHFCSSEYEMTIYGAVTNPLVWLNGVQVSVTCSLATGEYLRISSEEKSVVKHGVTGQETNLFNMRNKSASIFSKVPEGIFPVSWEGSFAFDLTVFLERSEPLWS